MGNQASIPGWGRSPGEGNGNPLQYSYLEYPMDGGTWRAIVRGVTESDTTEQLHFLSFFVGHTDLCCIFFGVLTCLKMFNIFNSLKM